MAPCRSMGGSTHGDRTDRGHRGGVHLRGLPVDLRGVPAPPLRHAPPPRPGDHEPGAPRAPRHLAVALRREPHPELDGHAAGGLRRVRPGGRLARLLDDRHRHRRGLGVRVLPLRGPPCARPPPQPHHPLHPLGGPPPLPPPLRPPHGQPRRERALVGPRVRHLRTPRPRAGAPAPRAPLDARRRRAAQGRARRRLRPGGLSRPTDRTRQLDRARAFASTAPID